MSRNPLLVPELRQLLAQGDEESLKEFCEDLHPAAVAELVSALEPEEVWTVLGSTSLSRRAEIFSHLPDDTQVEIVKGLSRQEAASLLTEMSPDDRADLFKKLPEESRDRVMPALAQAEREDIRRLIAYREGTAGAVMTSDYATLSPHITAQEAVERLREVAPDRETIYYAYVIDEERRLLGFVSLKDLILAKRDALVRDIMHQEVIAAHVDEDQEEVARKIQKFDLLAIPVVDSQGALVGIVTYDDAIDILSQEHTEDMEKLMAITGTHGEAIYLKTPVLVHVRNRAPWVVALAALGLVSGFIVQRFEGLIMQFAILAAFMPMLADTGGNTGSQAATLVIRALALREISPKDVFRVLAKELCVSLILALLLGFVAFGRVMLMGAGASLPDHVSPATVGLAVATALGIQVITSTLLGALLPLMAARFKVDPAVVASPALTTVVDITGLAIYFTVARWILGL